MKPFRFPPRIWRAAQLGIVVVLLLAANATADHTGHHSTRFEGVKANTGSVMHYQEGGRSYLELSDDFVVPNTPNPHWQLVDSRGTVYLLQALKVKDGKSNRRIEVPAFVRNVAKVQIWCAFAETLLGEASFPVPVK
jgi:hypothetical protein